jgi:hypothetical protein
LAADRRTPQDLLDHVATTGQEGLLWPGPAVDRLTASASAFVGHPWRVR